MTTISPGRRTASRSGERIIVTGRVLDANARAGPAHADRDLAGERRRPLSAPERPARRAARSELPRRRPHADRRRGPLPFRHDQARRVSVEEPLQRMAARAHPLLAVRTGVRDAARHADVFPRRSAARRRSDVREHSRRAGAPPADIGVRLGNDGSGAGARLPLRHRAPRTRRDADGGNAGRGRS